MKIRFTKGARRQFLAAIRYIAEDNQAAAERFRVRVEKRLRRSNAFLISVGAFLSSPDSLIEKSFSVRTASSTAFRVPRSGSSPSGVARRSRRGR